LGLGGGGHGPPNLHLTTHMELPDLDFWALPHS
jgi:hypothetical protein